MTETISPLQAIHQKELELRRRVEQAQRQAEAQMLVARQEAKVAFQECHGPVETIDDDVMAAIHEAYPEDQGVGFVEGDLRGWFWVEAPPGEAEPEVDETS